MPELPDRINGEIIEAEHMNSAQDRSVQRYADVTQRDSLNPAPEEGQMAWIESVNELQTYTGSAWFGYLHLQGGVLTGDLIMHDAAIPFRDSTGSAANRWIIRRTADAFQLVNVQTGNAQLDLKEDALFVIRGSAAAVWIEAYLVGGTTPALRMPAVYDVTNGAAPNVVVLPDGTLARSTAVTTMAALEARITALEDA